MPTLASCAVVFDAQGHILLTQREDYEVWCLPGGHVEQNESMAEAAIREIREETGILAELTHLVGLYSRPQWRTGVHVACFAARATGGQLKGQPEEVIDLGFFAPDQLPDDFFANHELFVGDALDGVRGTVASLDSAWPFAPDMPREEIYALRDASGLTRRDFYVEHFGTSTSVTLHRDDAGNAS